MRRDCGEDRYREASVTSGLILLVLIGVLIGFGLTRVRGKLGMRTTWGTWISVIAAVVIIGLALWVYSLKR
jgi:high-affinity Fe2+/Pb2+ permease